MQRLVICLLAAVSANSFAVDLDTQPLGLTRLQNSTYSGLEGIDGEVVLEAGHWEGPPPLPGSASVPRVDFVGDLVARGDLDGDGRDEAAVLLATNFGGTGVFHYVAIVEQRGAENRNIATHAVGDRIQLRSMHIEEGRLVLDLVRARPDDPACCPTEVVTLQFQLQGDRLSDPVQVGSSRSLTPEVLADGRWRLAAWKFGDPVQGRLTLAYTDGRFIGHAGCNEYFAPVTATDDSGSIEVGQAASTRKACDATVMSNEQRFLDILPRIERFWFHAGQLALAYDSGADSSVLFLDREE